MEIRVLALLEDAVCDGEGLRSALFIPGCFHNCPGCFNKESWNKDLGINVDIDKLVDKLISFEEHNITISGGDGLCYYYLEVIELCKRIKEKSDKNIWLYTGFTFDELLKDEKRNYILNYVDVVVDGKFIEELKDNTLAFRGSSNQLIIDVKESLKIGRIIQYLV